MSYQFHIPEFPEIDEDRVLAASEKLAQQVPHALGVIERQRDIADMEHGRHEAARIAAKQAGDKRRHFGEQLRALDAEGAADMRRLNAQKEKHASLTASYQRWAKKEHDIRTKVPHTSLYHRMACWLSYVPAACDFKPALQKLAKAPADKYSTQLKLCRDALTGFADEKKSLETAKLDFATARAPIVAAIERAARRGEPDFSKVVRNIKIGGGSERRQGPFEIPQHTIIHPGGMREDKFVSAESLVWLLKDMLIEAYDEKVRELIGDGGPSIETRQVRLAEIAVTISQIESEEAALLIALAEQGQAMPYRRDANIATSLGVEVLPPVKATAPANADFG